MKLAILSDTHDNIWAFDLAKDHMKTADAVLHCGDLCSPFMIPRLSQAAAGKAVHIVWGNNDGDKRLLMAQAGKVNNVLIHGEFADISLGGMQIFLNHYPEIAMAVAESDVYDMVCYGHDHTAHQSTVGKTILLNPGEIMGLNGKRTMVLIDTNTREIEWVEI